MLYERIFRKLNSSGVRYLAVGGIAVNLHGFPRATGDLDILLSFEPRNVDVFLKVAKELGLKPRAPVPVDDLKDPAKRREWALNKGMHAFTLVNLENPMEQLDVVIDEVFDFDAAYARRETVRAGEVQIPLICVDDLIALKEKSGRDRDLVDLKVLKELKEIKR